MKRPDNTEMDRLLHRYARRNNETLRAGREQSGDGQDANNPTHLDADELNAYAEGALPESARSRYFAHLADCDTCRKLVTDLTLAAAIADEQKAQLASVASSPSKSWRDWLAAIFSPPVLRYGVPALALFAVIIIAIVATRTRRDASFVAQKGEAARDYAPSATSNSNSSSEIATTSTTAESQAHSDTSSNASAPAQPQNPTAQTNAAGSPVLKKDGTIVTDAPAVAQSGAVKSAEEQTASNSKQPVPGEAGKSIDESVTVTSAPPPAPVLSAPTAVAENKDKREDRKRSQNTGNDDAVKVNTNAVGGATSNETEINSARTVAGRRAAPRAVQNLPATKPASPPKSEAINLDTEKERDTETRTVGGHKFRKQGSAWVDTAYKSSLSTINVRRGSEQYRALIADEPGLRAITQQLGGEVIVVWRGHAYRFY
jgi:hypothetical protein